MYAGDIDTVGQMKKVLWTWSTNPLRELVTWIRSSRTKRYISLGIVLLAIGVLPQTSRGQVISTEQIFPVDGYSVFQKGYPLKVSPGTRGKFVFLEYWAEGKEGRRLANYYLQSYGIRDYVEHWFKPVTMEGFDPMQVGGVLKLRRTYAVWGTQNLPGEKFPHRVARFFAHDGKPQTEEPVKLSTYTRKPSRKFRQRMAVSDNGAYFLWMGSEGAGQFLHMFDGLGNERWEKLVEFPYIKDGYEIDDLFVTNTGTVMVLLTAPQGAGQGHTGKPAVLLQYTAEPEALETLVLYYPSDADVLGTAAVLQKNNNIILVSALSRQGIMGIRNGTKGGSEDGHLWTHLDFKRLAPPENGKGPLEVQVDSLSSVPKKWIARYQEKGANFSDARILAGNVKTVFMFEEKYATRKKQYNYDLACMAFNNETGKRSWSQLIQKKQRDTPGSAFLSYSAGIAREKLRVVYLSERGARGDLMCT
ncbi:MAG: hypothetical protein AAFV07_18625, partial [Bacteroidota bacterium]